MLLNKNLLVHAVRTVLKGRIEQGADLDTRLFERRIDAAAGSYDALYDLAYELRDPPIREDWPYKEPISWEGIKAESPQLDPNREWPKPDFDRVSERSSAAFLGSVCGCILGKPVEVDPTLAELKAAGDHCGAWPLNDYISEDLLEALGRRHESWPHTVRDRISYVAADDDLHYTVLGMILLENKGLQFTSDDLLALWGHNLAPYWTWGAERTALLFSGLQNHHQFDSAQARESHDVLMLNPGDESCGALIRADAYGYACPGNPDLAAWLACKDASVTHIKTGVYGSMFIAALIAICQTEADVQPGNNRLDLINSALQRIPASSRFAHVVRDSMDKVASADDWLEAYNLVHGAYQQYSHCTVYQEIGTLINTFKFADSVDHGICLQVSQGNDTDSFGATAGSILGALFGMGRLNERWIAPFNNEIRLSLASFHERDLDSLAQRMGKLGATVYGEFQKLVPGSV